MQKMSLREMGFERKSVLGWTRFERGNVREMRVFENMSYLLHKN